jgi:hypothetical protein
VTAPAIICHSRIFELICATVCCRYMCACCMMAEWHAKAAALLQRKAASGQLSQTLLSDAMQVCYNGDRCVPLLCRLAISCMARRMRFGGCVILALAL